MPEPTATTTNTPTTPETTPAVPESFEKWLEGQDAAVKGLYETHVTGLRNTVKATRDERDTLAKQIKDLSAKAEKGSELEKTLAEFGKKLEASEQKAAFLEEATKPGIDCRNPRAAFALATSEGLFNAKGIPDWKALKEMAPELFGAKTTNTNGGNGTQQPPTKDTMNERILRKAGYRS